MTMNQSIRPTRSGLFAIELLVAVGIFSLCAAICIGLFVRSELVSQDSADLNCALAQAKNASECFKAAGGDLDQIAGLLGGEVENGVLTLRYDASWNTADASQAVFRLELSSDSGAAYPRGTVTVWGRDDEELLSWPVAALEVAA